MMNRREFVAGTAAGLLCATLPLKGAPSTPRPISAFEKPLLFESNEELAATMSTLGLSGVEAAVRVEGRVQPKNVENELPRFHEALSKRGLEITAMATDINGVDTPYAEKVLRTAAKLGIRRYRMMFFKLDAKKPIMPQVDAAAARLPALVALTRELGMTAIYQAHSGSDRIGGAVWDIYGLIKGYDPKTIGIGYDTHHAMVEGGMCWPITFKLVESHLAMVYVKDYTWEKGVAKTVPLGTGWLHREFFQMLRERNYAGPICLHEEYIEGRENEQAIKEAFGKDLATLRSWL
jgi:sugar phosphate isomerase/epimerase